MCNISLFSLILQGIAKFTRPLILLQVSLTFPQNKSLPSKPFSPRSCLDYYKKGSKSNGYYKIYNDKGETLTVYCDMVSEPGSAWTLVESFAFKYINVSKFTKTPLWSNAPFNENSPNRNLYKMTLDQMKSIQSQSTHWRITCNFPTSQVDYIDYVRGNFSSFDILTFSGEGICKVVEYVNIRGHLCSHCTSQWWQPNGNGPHIDSNGTACEFKPNAGAAHSEDNFGLYYSTNTKFRCTSGPSSTTNVWFGGSQ